MLGVNVQNLVPQAMPGVCAPLGQIKKQKMGAACGEHRADNESSVRNHNGKWTSTICKHGQHNNKMALRRVVGDCGLDSLESRYGPKAGYREHGDQRSVCANRGHIFTGWETIVFSRPVLLYGAVANNEYAPSVAILTRVTHTTPA
jgi:hypothetical protein